jgi:hypothetical protein
LLLLISAWIFLQTDFGQNWLAQKVTGKLSKDLQTKISIRHVSIEFFNRLQLEGVYIEDQKNDTLLYAGAVNVRITDWFFFKEKADLKYIGLDNAVIHLNRTDSTWNYAFLANYFASTDTVKKVKKEAGIEFNLQKVVLNNVTFLQKDAWLGSDMTVKLGSLDLDADELSASKKSIHVKNIELTDPYFSSLSYQGKGTKAPSSPMDWSIRFNNIKIKNGRFRQDRDNYNPTVPYFDAAHIDFTNINASFSQFKFQRDSLTGTLDLSATERSGFAVKKLKAALTVHPKAFVLADLFLQTTRSTLADHFELQFESTKSLGDFVHAVAINANFNQTSISSDDLAFFIPDAKTWKKNIKINGLVKGSVDALAAENLELWLGNNTYVNGNISVVGLPDITKTLLNIEAKALRTTYNDAVSFFPGWQG